MVRKLPGKVVILTPGAWPFDDWRTFSVSPAVTGTCLEPGKDKCKTAKREE